MWSETGKNRPKRRREMEGGLMTGDKIRRWLFDDITPILLDESFVLDVILPQMSPPAEEQFIRKIERIDQYGRND